MLLHADRTVCPLCNQPYNSEPDAGSMTQYDLSVLASLVLNARSEGQGVAQGIVVVRFCGYGDHIRPMLRSIGASVFLPGYTVRALSPASSIPLIGPGESCPLQGYRSHPGLSCLQCQPLSAIWLETLFHRSSQYSLLITDLLDWQYF